MVEIHDTSKKVTLYRAPSLTLASPGEWLNVYIFEISFAFVVEGRFSLPACVCSVNVCTHSDFLKSQILTVVSPLVVANLDPLKTK